MSLAVLFSRSLYDPGFKRLHFGTLAFVGTVTLIEVIYIDAVLANGAADWQYIPICLSLLAAGLVFEAMHQRRLALTATALGLLYMSLATNGLTSSLMLFSGRNQPLIDSTLAGLDHALGFNWRTHVEWLAQYPTAVELLRYAYLSIFYQPFILMYFMIMAQDAQRLYTFTNAMLLSMVILTVAVFFFPASGPYEHYHGGTLDLRGSHLVTADTATEPLALMRSGEPEQALKAGGVGLVYFPSFHTICAMIFIWAAWPTRIVKWVMLTANILMLAATPMHGSHYLVDMIAGAAVAAVSIWIVRRIVRSAPPSPAPTFGLRHHASADARHAPPRTGASPGAGLQQQAAVRETP
ncbi:phosphatase PAP2 family protein [Vineibacter terrae]|uniref:phosphatase PAP2 family protein n=1 Tax=Vineibacter terrae TaxID=2586908 RepID=UPI002E35B443|nr:phosphatase PAP2 family protein [Vineibacter terrae]HEX2885554.1 phosphatase PAP2 family protein [Vineibacter terrae]